VRCCSQGDSATTCVPTAFGCCTSDTAVPLCVPWRRGVPGRVHLWVGSRAFSLAHVGISLVARCDGVDGKGQIAWLTSRYGWASHLVVRMLSSAGPAAVVSLVDDDDEGQTFQAPHTGRERLPDGLPGVGCQPLFGADLQSRVVGSWRYGPASAKLYFFTWRQARQWRQRRVLYLAGHGLSSSRVPASPQTWHVRMVARPRWRRVVGGAGGGCGTRAASRSMILACADALDGRGGIRNRHLL